MLKICLIVLISLPMLQLVSSDTIFTDNKFECGPMAVDINPLLRLASKSEVIPCCNAHDQCYRTCGKSKEQCDCEFYRCLKRSCGNDAANECDGIIFGMFSSVRFGGATSYISNQRQSNCPPNDINRQLHVMNNAKNLKEVFQSCPQ